MRGSSRWKFCSCLLLFCFFFISNIKIFFLIKSIKKFRPQLKFHSQIEKRHLATSVVNWDITFPFYWFFQETYIDCVCGDTFRKLFIFAEYVLPFERYLQQTQILLWKVLPNLIPGLQHFDLTANGNWLFTVAVQSQIKTHSSV